nr:MAG TPA: hypothetical protein [Caudoviricetes sp.]
MHEIDSPLIFFSTLDNTLHYSYIQVSISYNIPLFFYKF